MGVHARDGHGHWRRGRARKRQGAPSGSGRRRACSWNCTCSSCRSSSASAQSFELFATWSLVWRERVAIPAAEPRGLGRACDAST
eukprot:4314245-Pleurochrysis_carterae.AAC.1